ncbi:hypothetical protein BDDG_06716 [Blastomyces dermatitidis ATCC 18188]|uniref:Uncharacterized protein n=1 Tax=Ajellomyces dermatitidis (strain ATCC 18188 / CBS 674.68) TaxID=653446 RepID=F2TKK8_AJEDA|nr:hypothetical protein BDDG_06716 [Blastomyces dermatitidis ATCC 18188]
MALYSHNKYHHSTYTEQFISKQCIIMNNDTSSSPSYTLSSSPYIFLTVSLLKSSHVDRFTSADDSELNVKSLIENLKNVIMKKLPVSCVAESFMFFFASSAASFSAVPLSVPFSVTSQSPTLAPVSGSPAPATPVPATPGFAASAFITSSPHFKKMLYRLNEPHLLRITSFLNNIEIVKKIIMSFAVYEVVMFTDIKKLFTTVKFNIAEISDLMNFFRMIDSYQSIL